MYGYVRIYVDVDSNKNIDWDSVGHYDLQIGDSNYTFDGRTYKYPVFAFGGNEGGQGYVKVFNRDDVEDVYPGKKCLLMTDDFEITDSDVNNFITKLKATINTSAETDGGAYYKYKVTSGAFQTYTEKTTNCFAAVAYWAKWLGYNTPMNILEDANGDNTKYYTPVTYAEYKDHWTNRGYIGF